MTRKHFQALADALRSCKPDDMIERTPEQIWQNCVNNIADACKAENGRFDKARFKEACSK